MWGWCDRSHAGHEFWLKPKRRAQGPECPAQGQDVEGSWASVSSDMLAAGREPPRSGKALSRRALHVPRAQPQGHLPWSHALPGPLVLTWWSAGSSCAWWRFSRSVEAHWPALTTTLKWSVVWRVNAMQCVKAAPTLQLRSWREPDTERMPLHLWTGAIRAIRGFHGCQNPTPWQSSG